MIMKPNEIKREKTNNSVTIQEESLLDIFRSFFEKNIESDKRFTYILTLGNHFMEKKQLKLSEICFSELLTMEPKDIKTKLEIELNLAIIRMETNRNECDETILLKLFEQSNSLQDRSILGKITLLLSKTYIRIGELEQAKLFLEKSIEFSLLSKDYINTIELLNRYSKLLIENGDSKEAPFFIEKSEFLCKYLPDFKLMMDTKIKLAEAYVELGNIKLAEETISNIFEKNKYIDDSKIRMEALILLSRLYRNIGEYDSAIQITEEISKSIPNIDKKELIWELDFSSWSSRFFNGELSIPLNECVRIYKMSQKTSSRFIIRKYLLFIIDASIFLGKFEDASKLIAEFESYSDTSHSYRMQYNFIHGIYNLYNGSLDLAENFLTASMEIANNYSILPYYLKTKLQISEVLMNKKDYIQASQFLDDLKSDILSTPNHYLKSKFYLLILRLHIYKNDLINAKLLIPEALKTKTPLIKIGILYEAYKINKALKDNIKAQQNISELSSIFQRLLNYIQNDEDRNRFLSISNRKAILDDIKAFENESSPIQEEGPKTEIFESPKKYDITDDNAYISTLDGEKMFGVSRITIFRWIQDGKLKATRCENGRFKILFGDLKNFIATQKMGKIPTLPTLKRFLQQEEKRYLKILIDTKKNPEELASILGISVESLNSKIDEYKIAHE
jgi:tetratricopeptide (TPR) repeat protein